jgi:trimethylamine--corrinoid protein Co-methyltransferase
MLDFESCFSIEKLILDNEICAMTARLSAGIAEREDFPAIPLLRELLTEQHLLISAHSRRHIRSEHLFTGPMIDRANQARWVEEGSRSLQQRGRAEVARLLAEYQPSRLPKETKLELQQLMENRARECGLENLPLGSHE